MFVPVLLHTLMLVRLFTLHVCIVHVSTSLVEDRYAIPVYLYICMYMFFIGILR